MLDTGWIGIAQIAGELGVSEHTARKAIKRYAYLGFRRRRIGRSEQYPAVALDFLKALKGQPHRTPTEPGQDWLSAYLGGTTHD